MSVFLGSFNALLRELVAEFTLTDNSANTTTSLLRSLCHYDDSVLLGSWLQETDHKSIEDQVIKYLEELIICPVCMMCVWESPLKLELHALLLVLFQSFVRCKSFYPQFWLKCTYSWDINCILLLIGLCLVNQPHLVKKKTLTQHIFPSANLPNLEVVLIQIFLN